MKTDALHIIISFGQSEPRIFSSIVCASAADVQAAIDEGMKEFNKAFSSIA
jgi:hypothetical protein